MKAHHRKKNIPFALRVTALLVKGLGLIFILAALMAGGLFFFATEWIDSEKVREALTVRLEQAINRPVEVQHLIITPRGIKLRALTIFDPADPEQPLLRSDFAVVTVKLRSLALGRIDVSNVRLVSPQIRLRRDPEGRWNFEGLFQSTGSASIPIGSLLMPVSLAAEQISIESGRLDVDDRQGRLSASIEKLNLSLHGFNTARPFAMRLSLDNASRFLDKRIQASLSMEGAVDLAALDWEQASVQVRKFDLLIDDKKVRGSGRLDGFLSPRLEADLNLPALGAEQWSHYGGLKLDLSLPASRWRLALELVEGKRLRAPRLRVSAGALALNGFGSVDFSAQPPKLEASFSLADFPLEQSSGFRPGLAQYGLKGRLSGQASVTGDINKPVISRLRVKVRGLEAVLAHAKIDGADLEASAAQDFKTLSLSLNRGALRAFSNAATDLSLGLTLSGRDLKIAPLSFKWGQGRVDLRARLLNIEDPKEISVSGRVTRMRWEDVQALFTGLVPLVSTHTAGVSPAASKLWVRTFKYAIPKKVPDSVGHVRIGNMTHKNFSFRDIDVLWDLRGITPTLRKADGDVRLSLGHGVVHDIQALQDSHKFLKIIFLPYVYMHRMNKLSVLSAATAYPKTLDFHSIEGRYSVTKGLVSTKFFHVDSPQLVAYADGTADFGRERVDMNILTRLTSYRAPLPEWWVDELGRPAIGFRVKGSLNRPELEPRLKKMAADEIEKAAAEGRRRSKARFLAIEKLQTL
ncbi:MAG: hypothetical protein HY549_13435 [Elusimicrobia bacterium]|nr:hypothetical protein [Elusimicrobiota bacterium]